MKKLIKQIICATLVIGLLFSNTNYVKAAEQVQNNNEYLELVEQLEPYIAKDTDGTLYLEDVPQSISINDNNYISIQQNIEMVNSMIVKGYLTADDNCNINVTKKYVVAVSKNIGNNTIVSANGNSLVINASKGRNDINWTWYGFDLYLDDATSKKVVLGTGLTAIAASFIPEPTVSKVLAAALGACSLLIDYNNEGNGVIIKFETIIKVGGVPTITPFWFSPQ